MTFARDHHRLKFEIGIVILVGSLCALAPGCGDDGSTQTGGTGGNGAGGTSGTGGSGGSGGSAMTFDLVFTGSGYGIHTGQTMYFDLFEDDNDAAPVASSMLVVDSDEITQTFVGVFTLFSGITYTLYYYADVNDNGMCDDGEGQDHFVSVTIAEPSGPVTITKNHTLTFNGDCSKHNSD